METKTTTFYLPTWFYYVNQSQPSYDHVYKAEYDKICASLDRELGPDWVLKSVSDPCMSVPELGDKIEHESCYECTFKYVPLPLYVLSFGDQKRLTYHPVDCLDNLKQHKSFFLEMI